MGKPGRGERIRTSGLYVPNVALYQAKLHPDVVDMPMIAKITQAPLVIAVILRSLSLERTVDRSNAEF